MKYHRLNAASNGPIYSPSKTHAVLIFCPGDLGLPPNSGFQDRIRRIEMNKAIYAPYGVQMATVLARGTEIGAHGAGGFVSHLIRLPVTLIRGLYTWQQRVEERNRIRHLDDRLLADMGMERADAERLTSLPFWRAS
jgi:uncharacterized protein YjiS (DUF1127 family)